MSGFTDFFQPTPTPAPRPVEPPGFDLLRDMLMRKIFALQANPYGLTGQTAQNPMGPGPNGQQPFFSTGPNMNAPALAQAGVNWGGGTGTSGGVPTQSFNPAYAQPGGVRHMDTHYMSHPAHGKSPIPGQRVPLHMKTLQQLLHARHFDAGISAPNPWESPNQMQLPTMHNTMQHPAPHIGNRIPITPMERPQNPQQIHPLIQALMQHNANGSYGNWGGVGQDSAGGQGMSSSPMWQSMQSNHNVYQGAPAWHGWQAPTATPQMSTGPL